MADQKLQGRILWYELLTTDMKAAEKFYTTVVGWTITPFPEAPDPYDMWTGAGGVPIGGVMKIPQGMNFPPHWGMYVGVTTLENGVGVFVVCPVHWSGIVFYPPVCPCHDKTAPQDCGRAKTGGIKDEFLYQCFA